MAKRNGMNFPKIDFIKFLVAMSLIAAFNFTIYALAYVEIPEGNRELFIHVIGMIDGAFVGSLVGFYWTRSHKGGPEDPTV